MTMTSTTMMTIGPLHPWKGPVAVARRLAMKSVAALTGLPVTQHASPWLTTLLCTSGWRLRRDSKNVTRFVWSNVGSSVYKDMVLFSAFLSSPCNSVSEAQMISSQPYRQHDTVYCGPSMLVLLSLSCLCNSFPCLQHQQSVVMVLPQHYNRMSLMRNLPSDDVTTPSSKLLGVVT